MARFPLSTLPHATGINGLTSVLHVEAGVVEEEVAILVAFGVQMRLPAEAGRLEHLKRLQGSQSRTAFLHCHGATRNCIAHKNPFMSCWLIQIRCSLGRSMQRIEMEREESWEEGMKKGSVNHETRGAGKSLSTVLRSLSRVRRRNIRASTNKKISLFFSSVLNN